MTDKEIKKEKNKKVNNVVITEKEMNSQIDLYDKNYDYVVNRKKHKFFRRKFESDKN